MNAPGFLTKRPIAHRGYHDSAAGCIENSLSAFRAAVDRDYAIELDVQLSRDGQAIVFHDGELDRLTGETGRVDARSADDLKQITLTGGQDTIQPLGAVLTDVAGRVPVVVEMKDNGNREKNQTLAGAVASELKAYGGPVAAMSFSHQLVRDFHNLAPDVPVGLTAEGTSADDLAAHHGILDIPIRFVSYNVRHLPNEFVTHVRDDLNLAVITWTVRDENARQLTETYADQMTFEGFDPDAR